MGAPRHHRAAGGADPAWAANCNVTSIGATPINDLGDGTYKGFVGGLYLDGSNLVPAAHRAEGLTRAAAVRKLGTNGQPSPTGSFVLLSVGMSNTNQEFCGGFGDFCNAWSFAGQAAEHPDVNDDGLVLVNGASGGASTRSWDDANDADYNRVRDQVLAPRGLSEAQVQVVWIKQANPSPSVALPAANADAYRLLESLGDIARAIQTRYPNVQMILLSSRIYAGYAANTLNPEPYAYESGFAVKWLIQAQIEQMNGLGIDPIAGDLGYAGAAPWLAWALYPWADGTTPRSDGLTWECVDVEADDGTHPSTDGEEKFGTLLLETMLDSEFTAPWFAVPEPSAGLGSTAALGTLVWLRARGRRRRGLAAD